MTFLSKLSILLIKKYQLHKKHGSYFDVDCNFIPSCSEYLHIRHKPEFFSIKIKKSSTNKKT